jgi:hypothetical protein
MVLRAPALKTFSDNVYDYAAADAFPTKVTGSGAFLYTGAIHAVCLEIKHAVFAFLLGAAIPKSNIHTITSSWVATVLHFA